MQRSYKRNNTRTVAQEQGAYLVMYTVILAILLVVGGFVVDASRIFRASRAIQKAADAGVLAALAYRAENGPSGNAATMQTEMEAIACRTFAANIVRDNVIDMTSSNPIDDAIMGCNPSGLAASEFVINPGDTNSLGVRLRPQLNVPLYFLDKFTDITGISNSIQNVVGDAKGRINPTRIALVLDFSGSMRCPRLQDCSCLNPASASFPCPDINDPSSKTRLLKDAVAEFASRFTDGYDYVSLIPFNMRSSTDIANGFYSGLTPLDRGVFNSRLALATPSSNTNPTDGFATAIGELNQPIPGANIPLQNQAVVFFTDGSPTAMTFRFESGQPDVHNNNTPLNLVDFVSYKAQFTDPGSGLISAFSSAITRANPLNGTAGGVAYGHNQALPVNVDTVTFPDQIDLSVQRNIDILAPCTDQPIYASDEPSRFIRSFRRPNSTGINGPGASDCLIAGGNLRLPGAFIQTVNHSGQIPFWPGDPFSNTGLASSATDVAIHFEEMYYNSAILAADALGNRFAADPQNSRRIFAVGLGLPAERFPDALPYTNSGYFTTLNATRPFNRGVSGSGKSPYQLPENVNARDDGLRKDYLLARIANDPIAIDYGNFPAACHEYDFNTGNPLAPGTTCSLAADFNDGAGFNGDVPTYAQLNPDPTNLGRAGEYLPTSDAAELRPLFSRIAKRIILRLIN